MKNPDSYRDQKGFTLLEMCIVVSITALIAMMGIPSYRSYMLKTKRADMMVELEAISHNIAKSKLVYRQYNKIPLDKLIYTDKKYPNSSNHLYTLTVENCSITKDADGNLDTTCTALTGSTLASGKWKLSAEPATNSPVADDGTLSLTFDGQKCRGDVCGKGRQWND